MLYTPKFFMFPIIQEIQQNGLAYFPSYNLQLYFKRGEYIMKKKSMAFLIGAVKDGYCIVLRISPVSLFF